MIIETYLKQNYKIYLMSFTPFTHIWGLLYYSAWHTS